MRRHRKLFDEAVALRVEVPARSAAHIADILWERHKIRISPRTIRAQLAARGVSRAALTAEPARTWGRYEASTSNGRWIGDVLVGGWVPYPRVRLSRRARLFLLVDDYSRLIVHGEWHYTENTVSGQHTLRHAIDKRGLPSQLYVDNGAPYVAAPLARTCAVLGIRLVHSRPYRPEGRGKQERLNRYIRERFLVEAEHAGIENLDELNERWTAWAEHVANGRIHAETNEAPIARWTGGHPNQGRPRGPDPKLLADAFKWSAIRTVTKVATVSLDGNRYRVDPSLVGRRIELRYDPADPTDIAVYHEGDPVGIAVPEIIGNHVTKHATAAELDTAATDAEPTGIDYLQLVFDSHDAATTGEVKYRTDTPQNTTETENDSEDDR